MTPTEYAYRTGRMNGRMEAVMEAINTIKGLSPAQVSALCNIGLREPEQ